MTIVLDSSAGITFPNSTIQASAGSVLQVVNATFGTRVSSSTSTYADTGLSASITPKFSTSKILILVNMNDIDKVSSDTQAGLRILRGSTVVCTFTTAASYTQSSSTSATGAGTSYLDSPSTTSSTTYKVQFASVNNTAYVAINDGSGLQSSSITLMEIAG